ncbi:hypothetical protein P5V15_013839 [Pogonomyrmex californicus]
MELHRVIHLVLLPATCFGLTGYDCGGSGLNIITLSLLDIGMCNVEDLEPKSAETYVQLMQASEYHSRAVQIGDRSHNLLLWDALPCVYSLRRKQYVKEIGRENCQRIHDTGTLNVGTAVVDRLKINATNHRSVTMAGAAHATAPRCSTRTALRLGKTW